MALYRRYRPVDWNEVIGQSNAVGVLKKKIEDKQLPHVVMLVGPSGTGKTTLARIAATKLGCNMNVCNFSEINTADIRGIDLVREIDSSVDLKPMGGEARVWILDEVVQLPSITQKAFLKVLEEPPPHAWFFLCTTETNGLLPTFLSRCLILTVDELLSKAISIIVRFVATKEGRQLSEDVLNAICTAADGNARKALNILESVLSSTNEDRQLLLVESSVIKETEKGEFLGRLLIKKAKWTEMLEAVKEVQDKDIEGLRRQILGYMAKCMIGRDALLASRIIDAFDEPFYQSGKAGFLAALFMFRESKGMRE